MATLKNHPQLPRNCPVSTTVRCRPYVSHLHKKGMIVTAEVLSGCVVVFSALHAQPEVRRSRAPSSILGIPSSTEQKARTCLRTWSGREPLMLRAERLCCGLEAAKPPLKPDPPLLPPLQAAAAAAADDSNEVASSDEEEGLNSRDLPRPLYRVFPKINKQAKIDQKKPQRNQCFEGKKKHING